MSNERSYRPSDSTTIGINVLTSAPSVNVQPVGCITIRNLRVAREESVVEVTREVVLDAPVEEVWSALTEPERLEEWFANDVELELEPGGEGTFRWDDGEERHAVVEEVDPERRFAFT